MNAKSTSLPMTVKIIQFPFKGGCHEISTDQIVRIQAANNYSIIYTTCHKQILMAKVLSAYEELLRPFGFLRTHKSHLINPRHINSITRQGQIRMKDDSEVEISRRKRRMVLTVAMRTS